MNGDYAGEKERNWSKDLLGGGSELLKTNES